MKTFEVIKAYEDGTEEILFQNMDEHGACLLSYKLNMGLSMSSKYFHESREQKNDVPINLRIRK